MANRQVSTKNYFKLIFLRAFEVLQVGREFKARKARVIVQLQGRRLDILYDSCDKIKISN